MTELENKLFDELKEERHTSRRAMECMEVIVNANKETININNKHNKNMMLWCLLIPSFICVFFIFGYFFSSYDSIKENNSNYNYNENINKSIMEGGN